MSTDRDTAPMGFGPPHRDRPALRLVESPGWKISTNVIGSLLLSICAWGLNTVAEKVGKIDAALNSYAIQSATNEQRMQRMEADNGRQDTENSRQGSDIRALQDKQAAITFRLDSISDRVGAGRKP